MAATKSDMAHLTRKIDNIQSEVMGAKSDVRAVRSEMKYLRDSLTMQMKGFIETVSERMNT
jgi:hypothetical protein